MHLLGRAVAIHYERVFFTGQRQNLSCGMGAMKATRRELVWLIGGLLLLRVLGYDKPARGADARRAPNIVLIVADDLGWGDVGFNGRTEWSTPNLDRLAAQGRVFQRCYTAAVVCAPSRASFLTGKYTIHSGASRNDDDLPTAEVTIAEALKPLGYTTALFGKWHHGKPPAGKDEYVHPMDQGFDEFFGYTDAVDAWEKFPTTLWSGRQRVPASGYIDDLITDRAVEFVGRLKGKPFFLYLPYVATHFGIAAPADEVSRHRGKLPETDPDLPLNATYAAMVTRLDANVGRLVETLDKLDLTRETLIVFTSDHGATFESGNRGTSAALDSNRPFRGQKRTLWEGGIRVPAFARWPGRIPAGVSTAEVMHLTDLLPTFVEAAGGKVDPAWHVDGANLVASWTGKAGAPERTLFWEWRSEGSNQVAALRGQYKLVITRGGKPELYDVVVDPGERRDISAGYPEMTRRLRDELKAWLETETHR
jgi:arylsulfatase A